MTPQIDTIISHSAWAAILLAPSWQLNCSSWQTFAIKYPGFTTQTEIRFSGEVNGGKKWS